MKSLFNKAVLLWSAVHLSACSVYQSEGRKFLEKQAFEYTGAQAHLIQCTVEVRTESLGLEYADSRAEVFRLPANSNIRVLTRTEKPYSCDYGFTSSDERDIELKDAIELTVRLGEFANSHIYPLK